MITLKLAASKKAPTIEDQLKSLPNVRTIKALGSQSTPPTEHLITFNVFRAGGQRVAADYFAVDEPGGWYGDTTISLALKQPLEAEQLEALRKLLEDRINEMVEAKYSYFIEIVGEACEGIPEEYGVAGHSSYVPS